MALSAKVGVFTANTVTGNQPVTGVGFQPKALIFFAGNLTADGNGAGGMQALGFAASSSQREAVASALDDGVGSSNSGIDLATACIVLLTDGTPTVDAIADFVTMDVDGFTINWTDAPASAVKINYIALGGSDITNVEVGNWTGPTTAGIPKDHPKTGMAFQPDMVLFAPARNVTATGTAVTGANGLSGFTKFGGTFQQVGMARATPDASTTNNRQYERIDKALVSVSTVLALEATAVSFNSDGWTLNFTTVATSSVLIPYLAIKGGQWKFGSDSTPTATGSQVKSGIGFVPRLLMVFGLFSSASTSLGVNVSSNEGVGAASSAAAARAISLGVASTGLVAKNRAADAKIISAIDSGLTLRQEASVTSLDADGWTLNFTTVQGTAREYLWLAAGEVSSPPVNSTPPSAGGGLYVGGVLTTNDGTWSNAPTSFTYQWQRDTLGDLVFSNIASATLASYTLAGADQSCNIRCVVTATNAGGSVPANSNSVGLIGPSYPEPVQDGRVEPCANATSETFTAGANVPVNTVAPAVTGSKFDGATLSATTGTWTFVPTGFTYQWQRADDAGFTTNVTSIGANVNTYALTSSEITKYVRCRVTASNVDGSGAPANSNTMGAIGPAYAEPVQDGRVNVVSPAPTESYVDPTVVTVFVSGGAMALMLARRMIRH